jgi:UDP-glucose 4-epimerase
MRICITGGAGFIGSNLARHLTEQDWVDSVIVLDDLSTGDKANLIDVDAELHEGSICDPDALDAVVADADAIVHLAAIPSVPRSIMDPISSHHANATGTLQVLEATRRHGNPYLTMASSSSVYGANMTLPKSEDLRAQPMSPYAVAKLAAESYALAYANCFQLEVLPFRFFNVFGPGQAAGHAYAAAIPAFLDAAIDGRPIPIHGDGLQSRDFTYVGTVCRTLAAAVKNRVTSSDPVNLAFGSRLTLLDVVNEIERQLGTPLERDHQPTRAGDVRHSQADGTRLHRLFGDIEPVDFRSGLASTIQWFRGTA